MKTSRKKIVKRRGYSLPYLLLFGKKLHVSTIGLLALVALFIYRVADTTLLKMDIAENGKIVKGYIYDSRRLGGKGTVYHHYTFKVGSSFYESKAVDGDFSEKDSMYIVFDGQSPDRNWALKHLEKDHPALLKHNLNYIHLSKSKFLKVSEAH
ncbi:hypothetical protein [Pontibacter cellulosilyticus]|uniref:Uncharacterized protein n=1 Tax=Pontibacter cellulosilyticus TaxID=1720253 RepID=A0A923SIU7_9BACT|nr:hypothetical protein [Pontibacter cellulosilyticus]MBC5993204.1 hypothetical protein [Pontibacter cellulosilyticus]